MVAGKRYFGASAELDDGEARHLQWATREMFRLLAVFVMADALPFLRWSINKISWIVRRRGGDFMDVMLAVLEDQNLFGYEADVVNKATCLTMIVAATDSTMVTLTWALSLLLNNRHVLKKAHDEIDIRVGKDKRVEESA
ncbi:hypothetical protein IFM89_005222 [Coptis chinensis]|uniref:Cytochrome P450 n=1 Tax=Coptis chinensis TaxID=261450 RepID=A0A835LLG0_9MAGN|nr:hypothetical protein IFM89_005222 [Coptis chinensis]